MGTTALISFPQMYNGNYIDFQLIAKTNNLDKRLSCSIIDENGIESFESIFYLEGVKKQFLGQAIYPCDENMDINIPGPTNTAALAMLSKDGNDFCIRASTDDPSAPFKRIGRNSASVTSFVLLDDMISEADPLQPAIDRAPFIYMPDMLMTASCTLEAGKNRLFKLLFQREDGSSGSIKLIAMVNPINDNYGNTYTHQFIIDNMDGTAVASYDIAGNVWLNIFQASALYTDNTGLTQVDVDLAWGPDDYRSDSFRVLYSTLADTLRRGNQIIQGNTPDYAGQGGIDNFKVVRYKKVGNEFKEMRNSGKVINVGKKIDTTAFKKLVSDNESAKRTRRFY